MKDANLFFSEVLRKQREPLSDAVVEILRDLFFPGVYAEDPNRQLLESEKDMMSAYNRWEAEQAAQAKKHEAEKPLPPMTDAEIEEIAKMF